MGENDYSTGWYGIPGGPSGGQVHIAFDKKPVCGQHVSPKAEFQWCAHGIHHTMVECEKCKAWHRKLLCSTCHGRGKYQKDARYRFTECVLCHGSGYIIPAIPAQ